MSASTRAKVEDIFRAVFELTPDADVTRVRIESEFSITLDAADALRMTSFQATQLLLEEKGL